MEFYKYLIESNERSLDRIESIDRIPALVKAIVFAVRSGNVPLTVAVMAVSYGDVALVLKLKE